MTRHGERSGTKVTTISKTTKLFVFCVLFVIFVPAERGPWAVARWRVSPQAQQGPQQPPPTQAQQRPIFRGGTHFVRVDAYPTEDGKIVEGLKPEDFEILEDGKPQTIESFDFIKFDTFTPEAERRESTSQRDGFDKAADIRYRVFVIYADMAFSRSAGAIVPVDDLARIRQPLVNFLDRVMGPQDLYGFLTSRNSVKDLVLAQKTAVTRLQIQDLWRAQVVDRDEADEMLDRCSCGPNVTGKACETMIEALKQRYRADQTYSNLREVVAQLGSLRQERKNLVLATNQLPRWRPDDKFLTVRGPELPKVGIAEGRITSDTSRVAGAGKGMGVCTAEFQRLAMMDFEPRYRFLLDEARRENVSFYVIMPGGLQAFPDNAAIADLKSLASETDGIAIVNTNDLDGGMKKIADDLAAYYVLGYYTTNTKFDGGIRQIKVRYKTTGRQIRARRQYRAPTREEIAALSRSPSAAGPSKPASTVAPTLVGKPAAFLIRPRSSPEPADLMRLTRTDRVRFEWPVIGTLDQRIARLLDRMGNPLPLELSVAEQDRRLAVDLPLAPFARGDYSVELTIGSGALVERSLVAFRIQ